MKISNFSLMLNEDKTVNLIKESEASYPTQISLRSPRVITEFINNCFHLNRKAEEYIYMISLDSKENPLGVFEISHGTVNVSCTSPREIFIRALLSGAVNIVLVHNHPSGDVSPSDTDIATTKRLAEAGRLLSVTVLDHIIIGANDSYCSIADKCPDIFS